MTKYPLVPREGVYEKYWHFVGERQRIFDKRVRGEAPPWTDDPIFTHYKFCNVFRSADRESQYMIRDICYGGAQAKDLAFEIVAFRTFSRGDVWDKIKTMLGHAPNLNDLDDGSFENALTTLKESGQKLYTGSFILCANEAYGRKGKHLNHVEMFRAMFLDGDLYERVIEADTFGEVYEKLHSYPLMGDFMSYQTAIDLNYSELIDFSENDFTKAGPGALRGIDKVFADSNGWTPEEVIMWMVDHQEEELDRLGIEFGGLFGRPLHAIDAQNVFCETDKYCRQAVPELASNRTRIKTKFAAKTQPIRYFFPPKWGLTIDQPEVSAPSAEEALTLF
ncbi:MAG: putative DNA base hypermodification protein [Propionibacteriaceae bacterium]|nr:putative DNA base hypermodification protein [Propionibacteriaceae bacterium]